MNPTRQQARSAVRLKPRRLCALRLPDRRDGHGHSDTDTKRDADERPVVKHVVGAILAGDGAELLVDQACGPSTEANLTSTRLQ